MLRCVRCSRNMPPQFLYCALCGARLPHALGAGGVLGERYQVQRLLTSRALHGMTFLAQDTQNGQPVVLKELRDDLRMTPESREEFQEEIQTIGRLRVEGVPAVRGLATHEGRRFLVLEFVPGKTLRAMLQKQHRLPTEQAILVFKTVLKILDGLHNQFPPLLHLDVTPDNILLAGWDKAYLLDGSYWKALGNPFAHRGPVSSVDYAAPEALHGHGTAASDLFSLGLAMLEAVTGTPAAALYSAETNRHQWEPLADRKLQMVLSRVLEGSPALRFSTAAQVLAALDAPAPAAPSAPPPAPATPAPAPAPAPAPSAPAPAPAAPSVRPGFAPGSMAALAAAAPPPTEVPYQRPTLTAAAAAERGSAPLPAAPAAPPAPASVREKKEVKAISDNIDEVSTEEGLEALMALYENMNS